MSNFEIFFNIDIKDFKLNVFIVDKINGNNLLNQEFKFDKLSNSNFLIVDKINNILKKLTEQIEKQIHVSVGKINLMSAQETSQNIDLSIKTNFETMETNLSGVFAAGDIIRGASLVVWAIKDGRDAAVSIDKYLKKKLLHKIKAA